MPNWMLLFPSFNRGSLHISIFVLLFSVEGDFSEASSPNTSTVTAAAAPALFGYEEICNEAEVFAGCEKEFKHANGTARKAK